MLRKDHSQDNSTTAEAAAQVTNVRIIQQRADMIGAIGPGTASYAKLPSVCQAGIQAIAAKGLIDWTDADTGFIASMFSVAVHC